MLNHLITNHGTIAPFDLSANGDTMKQPWDPNTPFETPINQIEDVIEFAEAGQDPFTDKQIVDTAHTLVFQTGVFHDACKEWSQKPTPDKTWANFKTHFTAAHSLHRQQQSTMQAAGCGTANAIIKNETIEALANLATATAADRDALANLTNAVATLTAQLAEKDKEIQSLKTQLKKLGTNTPGNNQRKPLDPNGHCWSHGHNVAHGRSSKTCTRRCEGHKEEATRTNAMGGSQKGKPK